MNPERSDNKYMETLERKEIDIDIQMLTRAQLPDQVRPKPSPARNIPATNPMQEIGQKRGFQDANLEQEIMDFEECD